MPNFPLVDAHVHFYDQQQLNYPWLTAVPAIQGSYLPDDFTRASRGVDVEKLVFVEVDVADEQRLDEVRFVEKLIGSEPRIAALVASAAVESGAAVEAELERLSAIGTVHGIRRLIQYHRDADYCLRPGFIKGVRRLARFDLSFDLCIRHDQLASATELVRRCPEVNFILDHIAKPGIATGLKEPWMSEIKAIAALPNVVCKITGVATEAHHQNWTVDEIRPYIAHVIEHFGFEKIIFASDWPVMNMAIDYSRWVNIMDEILRGSSEHELRQFYCENATRTYRLG
ncbi:hypothetical protein BIY29_01850 [Brenneria alni]|uniref:Amidohydrolase-related domain-containing protein n=1 Tax=Brenneria alni TaxID=71656 RepID=A0A421DTG8_9GAMM|nr:amidohydrolase family protein [Brenneria alni]RLM27844.1 hypothetical protein BIY29_01850 [Brenneria alni]